MNDTIISVEHLSKKYKLGEIGVDSLREAAERIWHRICGRDPEKEMGIVGERAENRNLKPERVGEEKETAEGEKLEEGKECFAEGNKGNKDLRNSSNSGFKSQVSSFSFSSEPQVSGSDEIPGSGFKSQVSSFSSELWALRDVSFEVKRGEVLGIIGRNGAGKSTLLKILSRITEPTSGRAVMRGRVGSLLEVGTGFHPELTGRENIFLNGAILGMRKKEIENKFDEIVAFAEIEKFIDTPVKRYSSGMYVRLAFAVAAHLDPEILIVDEVLAVGDAAFQKKCLGKMSDVATKEGRTVLFVSHNLASVKQLCQKVQVLDHGAIVYEGPTLEGVDRYLKVNGVLDMHIKRPDASTSDMSIDAVKLMDRKGVVRQDFECDDDISVRLECNVKRGTSGLYGALGVMRDQGVIVMFSDSSDFMNNTLDNLEPGKWSLMITIPRRTLAPGVYELFVTMTNSRSVENPTVACVDKIPFRLNDSVSVRGNNRLGYFSTILTWNAERRSD